MLDVRRVIAWGSCFMSHSERFRLSPAPRGDMIAQGPGRGGSKRI